MAYDRPATAGDVQRAQFLNYLRAPKPLQQAMQQYSPDSDAYRGIQNSMASAEEDMGFQRGPNFNPNAGRLDWSGTAGRQPANVADLVQRTVGGLGPNHPLTSYLNPQAEQQRRAARQASSPDTQARIDGQTPTYRGMAGVGQGGFASGTGEMQNVLYPIAGRAREYSTNIGAVGLPGTGMTSQTAYEGARGGLVAKQEAGRRGEKFEAKKAAKRSADIAAIQRQNDLEDKIILETIKSQGGTNSQGISDWMQHLGQVRKQQAEYDEIALATAGKKDDEPVQVGSEFRTVADWKQVLVGKPRPSLTPYNQWVSAQGQLGDPRFAGATPQPTPAQGPTQEQLVARQQGFKTLNAESQKLYNAMDADQREKFWASVGL